MIDNIFGNTSHEEVGQAPSAVGAHGNHIGIDLVRKIQDTILFIKIISGIKGIVV
jgi:hypothetical protein